MEMRFCHKKGDFLLDISANVAENGLTALFGQSGCGKTTLLRCIAGLEYARHARFQACGRLWQDSAGNTFVPVHRRPFGMVFQEANLFGHISVRNNVLYGYRRTKVQRRRFRIQEISELLGIDHLLDRMPHGLSGGERQRVAVARALSTSPRLLLMDEPLSALDARSKEHIMPFLERVRDELAIPIIYVSHSLHEVARLADRMLIVDRGVVKAGGPLNEVITRLDLPLVQNNEAGATLSGRFAEHDVRYKLSRVECDPGSLWIPLRKLSIGTQVRVHIKAREVSLALSDSLKTSALNTIPAVVESMKMADDSSCLVRLRAGCTYLLSHITLRSAAMLDLRPGKKVFAYIKTAALVGA
ncbi:MAG: molybdenum ABC transporter ATP-binding protein [Chitinivibrionales bacterium]|nr:molybdenum ABC transporter ATP-binding protein [Chitinivibrionales bacterium]MBD3356458.1 molybdenum ABC transporter ATP-binding protein [Chitinivibrionales bacterium]